MAVARGPRPRAHAAMLDHLGENVETAAQAPTRATPTSPRSRRSAARPRWTCAISVEAHAARPGRSVEDCLANVEPMLRPRPRPATLVMIDMEAHAYVDRTLEVAARGARAPSARRGGAPVVPAPHRRRRLRAARRHARAAGEGRLPRAARRRLSRDKEDVDAATRGCSRRCSRAGTRSTSRRTIRGCSRASARTRRCGRRRLVTGRVPDAVRCPPGPPGASSRGAGYPVRVYIPYGTEWYPYLTRGWPSGLRTCGSSCRTRSGGGAGDDEGTMMTTTGRTRWPSWAAARWARR